MASATAKLGVDIGGTFTDVVLEADGRRHTTKVLTTPQQPEKGGAPGQGLIGMRERAAQFGGDLIAGPEPEGGWAVATTMRYLHYVPRPEDAQLIAAAFAIEPATMVAPAFAAGRAA